MACLSCDRAEESSHKDVPLELRYQGSLTTPPCSEGVEWLVGVNAVELSREPIETFRAIFH